MVALYIFIGVLLVIIGFFVKEAIWFAKYFHKSVSNLLTNKKEKDDEI